MKRLVSLMLSLALLLCAASAMAEVKEVNAAESRAVTIQPAGDNTVEEGISPTTGRNLADVADELEYDGFLGMYLDGRYNPVLVQIDDTEGGVGTRAPWFASYADVIYETPLHMNGTTRMSMIYSDTQPEFVGPVRSIRVNHLWIREEWNSPFLYAGRQAMEGDPVGTSVPDQMELLGLHNPERPNSPGAPLMYDGTTGGKAWNDYCFRVTTLRAPHNAVYNLAGIVSKVIPNGEFTPNNHTYKFADELPAGGDEAPVVYVSWGNNAYNSKLVYVPAQGVYERYVNSKNYTLYDEMAPENLKRTTNDAGKTVYKCTLAHGNAITFSNVIVQFMDMEYAGAEERPKPTVTGSGNAEYFMGGKHYSGVWNRETLQDRTVFYDMEGNEMPMQRGKTLIIMMDYATSGRSVSYDDTVQ